MCSISGMVSVPAGSRGLGRDPGGRRRDGGGINGVVDEVVAVVLLGELHAPVAASTPAPTMPPRTSRRDQRRPSTMGSLLPRHDGTVKCSGSLSSEDRPLPKERFESTRPGAHTAVRCDYQPCGQRVWALRAEHRLAVTVSDGRGQQSDTARHSSTSGLPPGRGKRVPCQAANLLGPVG